MTRFFSILALVLALVACGGGDSHDSGDQGNQPNDQDHQQDQQSCSVNVQSQALEQIMTDALDASAKDPAITSDPDFTLLLQAQDGRTFNHSQGNSTASTVYESASTSKLVTAVVILDLVDQGYLTLDTKAHDLLPFWTETSVTLRHLLSFTSGFHQEPACVNFPVSNFEKCVESIYSLNSDNGILAGSQFYYSSSHMQVAGLMAMKASFSSSWNEIFERFKVRTGLFTKASYDLPSDTNPRLAGGMHWTADEYLAFLRALYTGQVLSDAMRTELFANQRGSAQVIYSPALGDGTHGAGEDWAYGLGNWLECSTATEPGSFNCGSGHRNSSPGAYGAYPFIDFENHYFGILARQGPLGSGFDGVAIFRAAQDTAKQWAALSCPPPSP